MQKDWIRNSEEGLITGVLVWDLSAAFDTLDIELFLKKMALYGADKKTLSWFKTFLTERTQRVRIGTTLSAPLRLTEGRDSKPNHFHTLHRGHGDVAEELETNKLC